MTRALSIAITIAVFIPLFNKSFAQQTSDVQNINAGKPHQVWFLSKTDRLRVIGGGELYRLYDDSLTIITGRQALSPVGYSVQNIDQIWLRQKGKIAKGVIMGAVTGLILGVTLGYVSGDGPVGLVELKAGEKAALGGATMAPIGGFIGLALGARKIKIPIDRQKDKYLRVRDKLNTVLYSPQQ